MLIVTDRLTKERHYIPILNLRAKYIAYVVIKYIYLRYSPSETAVIDRESNQLSAFFRRLNDILGTKQKLLIAYYLETNRQSKNTNKGIEQYIRIYVDYAQDDQVDILLIAEFADNNKVSETIIVLLFFAIRGYNIELLADSTLANTKLELKPIPRE